jgi:hypothetical protein
VTTADVNALITGWQKEKTVNGVRVGDINTIRDGDLNFDGITDIADAYLLHQGLLAATGAGLDFSLLPTPEPSGLALAALALAGGAAARRRRGVGRYAG